MTTQFLLQACDEAALRRFAALLAAFAQPGDVFALEGDLGAGKTTFARAMINALLGTGAEEIPSPTFTLVQTYCSPRMDIAHLDLYRLTDPAEVDELGLEPALKDGIALVEWPDHGGDRIPADRFVIRLSEAQAGSGVDPDRRDIAIEGRGAASARTARLFRIVELLERIGWRGAGADIAYLQGDASARRYAKVTMPDGAPLVLMDWPRQADGPPIRDGKPYSRIAHLAEDVRPFVAIAKSLREAGIAAPRIIEADLDTGVLVIEHLGEGVFGTSLAAGADQATLWRAALDVLLRLRRVPADRPLAVGDGTRHSLPRYDSEAMAIEVSLLIDWLWPHARRTPAPPDIKAEYTGLWEDTIRRLVALPGGWVLRDYHSPNLIWRPERSGLDRVGVIDFQDAMRGPLAYDVVSLLQDARVDVPAPLECVLLDAYCAARHDEDSDFDEPTFRFAYAALGAQRASKILGIFARLARRDGKPQYLAHMPRVWRYLNRSLAHPELAAIAAFHNRHLADIGRR